MESLKKIEKFLSGDGSKHGGGFGSGDGSSSGCGDGSGYCCGDGDDSGCGDGSGYCYSSGDGSEHGGGFGSGHGVGSGSVDGSGFVGSGFGSNYGYGYGYGCGDIKTIGGDAVRIIDGIATIIYRIHGNIARAAILKNDLTQEPCYVVTGSGYFAHGKTVRDALAALQDKILDNMPEAERIDSFVAEHRLEKSYQCRDLYEWHHRLTGSCEMGRRQFADANGIDIDNDEMTVEDFIRLTKSAYGGDVIKKLEERYVRTRKEN